MIASDTPSMRLHLDPMRSVVDPWRSADPAADLARICDGSAEERAETIVLRHLQCSVYVVVSRRAR
jgi:hypothetical protein